MSDVWEGNGPLLQREGGKKRQGEGKELSFL